MEGGEKKKKDDGNFLAWTEQGAQVSFPELERVGEEQVCLGGMWVEPKLHLAFAESEMPLRHPGEGLRGSWMSECGVQQAGQGGEKHLGLSTVAALLGRPPRGFQTHWSQDSFICLNVTERTPKNLYLLMFAI